MNRSTNLFYANGENSKFITFANYTESLTGNFMSTNTKLFPSKFICMYIDGLNNKTKPVFIKYLAAYYENKMAFLRDHLEKNNINPENELKPLNYLLEALVRLQGFNQYIKIDKTRYKDIQTLFTGHVIWRKNESNPLEYVKYYPVNTYSEDDEENIDWTGNLWNDDYYTTGTYHGEYAYSDDDEKLEKALLLLDNIDSEYEAYLEALSNGTIFTTLETTHYATLKTYSSHNADDDNTIIQMTAEKLLPVLEDIVEEKNVLYYFDEVTDLSDLTIADYADIPSILADAQKQHAYITFVGDVTEQDYNGTYSDTICVIDATDYPRGMITAKTFDSGIDYSDMESVEYINSESYTISEDYLYGWAEYKTDTTGNANSIKWYPKVPGYYYGVKPITDDEVEETTDDSGDTVQSGGRYYMETAIDNIDLTTTIFGAVNLDNILFNIVIPLYDVVDVDYTSNTVLVKEEDVLMDSVDPDYYAQNVPMGIWFSGDDPVTLKRNDPSGYFPSWSLTLASQFKPFPASVYMPTEVNASDARTEAWLTFSLVLTKQNNILNKLTDIASNVSALSTRLTTLEAMVNTTGCAYYLDDLHKEMLSFESNWNTNFDLFKDEIYAYTSSLTWKYRES